MKARASRRPPRQFSFRLRRYQLRFPRRHVVKVVRLNLAAGQDVGVPHNLWPRRLGLNHAFHKADERLRDAKLRSDPLLGSVILPTPLSQLHAITSEMRSAVPARDTTYCDPLYLVNGHNEKQATEYNPVAYLFVMHPGNRLRQLRKAAKLSQQQLGEGVGLSQEAISQLENDKRPLTLDYMRAPLPICLMTATIPTVLATMNAR
jgi:DNA-binding XRE family transcriptional regulator